MSQASVHSKIYFVVLVDLFTFSLMMIMEGARVNTGSIARCSWIPSDLYSW
jgi:hypothetical protein